MAGVDDIRVYRWRLLDRKNMTLDRAQEQSNPGPQGTSAGQAEVPLLPQNPWHGSQPPGFSGHILTAFECPDHRMGATSSPIQMFQFASSSLSSALSPSVSSSNPTPMYLRPDCAPSYLTGNCGSPTVNRGSTPTEMDYDDINQDHHRADPDRGATSAVIDNIDISLNPTGACSPVRFSVPTDPSSELPPANVSIPNNAHSHVDLPDIGVEAPCISSTLPLSIPQISSIHDEATACCVPIRSIPETLVLEEATIPVSFSKSGSASPAKPKRGNSYKLSSSLPVTLE